MSQALFRRCVRSIVQEIFGIAPRKLRVFDFDDTLVKTDARVGIVSATGEKTWLTPGEYAIYEKSPGDQLDFSEFDRVTNPRVIQWTFRILDRVVAKHGPEGFVILTARAEADPVQKFLDDAGIAGAEVVALGNSNPQAKADWISDRILEDDLQEVEFFDDSRRNVEAVRELKSRHPEVRIAVRHVT